MMVQHKISCLLSLLHLQFLEVELEFFALKQIAITPTTLPRSWGHTRYQRR